MFTIAEEIVVPRRSEDPMFKMMTAIDELTVDIGIQMYLSNPLSAATWFSEKEGGDKYEKLFDILEKGFKKCCEDKVQKIGMVELIEKMVHVTIKETTKYNPMIPVSPDFGENFIDTKADMLDVAALYWRAIQGEPVDRCTRLALISCLVQLTTCSEAVCQSVMHWNQMLAISGSLLFWTFLKTMDSVMPKHNKVIEKILYNSEEQKKRRRETLIPILKARGGVLGRRGQYQISEQLRKFGVEMTPKQVRNWYNNNKWELSRL